MKEADAISCSITKHVVPAFLLLGAQRMISDSCTMNEETTKKAQTGKIDVHKKRMLDQVPIEYEAIIRVQVQQHGMSSVLFVYKYSRRPNETTVSFAKKHYATAAAEPHTPLPPPARPPHTCSRRWCPESLASSRKRSTEAPRADVS